MTIRDWPEHERPREKLLRNGAPALSDAELLAIFIRTGTRGRTALDLARDLIKKFGGIRALIGTNLEAFCKTKGLGVAKYTQMQAAIEIARRYLLEDIQRGTTIASSSDAKTYLTLCMRDLAQEVFACLFLDARNRVIKYEELGRGSIDRSAIYPRSIVQAALTCNASGVIFAHNHPSGHAEPSQLDIEITQQLKSVLDLIDVRLLDHFIIGDQVISLADRGVI